jgi:DNA-binding NarL/FixJ family response regulator
MAVEPSTGEERAEALAAAGAALARAAWPEARELYLQALAVEESPEALEGLAAASWWEDDVEGTIEARERAYGLRRDRGETVEAGRLAALLAWDHGAMRGTNAVASGWLERARRLTQEVPASAEHAWLPLIEASFHIETDALEVMRLSEEASTQARAHGALDIEMTARTLQGLALVSLGRVRDGTRMLDEGAAAAVSGELHDPIAIGSCCCNMIIACERVRDFERVAQWCERLAAFCERTGQRPLLAVCRAHRGTVLTVQGAWEEAEAELTCAAGALAAVRPPQAGYARARLAQLRHRQGRLAEARELADRARGHVLAPLVRAEISFAEGDTGAALGHAERYLRAFGGQQPIESAAAFELLVPVLTRLGQPDRARRAYDELATICDSVGTDALRAGERTALATIARAERRADEARRALEDAIELYQGSGAPLDVAKARLALADVLAAQDRSAAALDHALAAAAVARELGAAEIERTAARLVSRLGGRSAAAGRVGLTGRELEVLTLVAAGLSNRQIAERLVLSEHTVHRHVANVFLKLGVSSRAEAVAQAAERSLFA